MAPPHEPIPIGFIVNPIAGMGGRVGLKGTDGVVAAAIAAGAQPVAQARAGEMLHTLLSMLGTAHGCLAVRWLTCSGSMGADVLREAGFTDIGIVREVLGESSRDDTCATAIACQKAGAALIVFIGGDGTARDLSVAVGDDVPILGVPAGVKMYSGVFGTNPARTAETLCRFLEGGLMDVRVEVLEIDEERYRKDELKLTARYTVRTPFKPRCTQLAKQFVTDPGEDALKAEIARHVIGRIRPGTLVLLGPGSTVMALATALGIRKTVLGIDAVVDGQLVEKDLDERRILALLARYPHRKLVLSPLGAQGFVLGRGNLQLSPEVVTKIGRANLIIVATPAKLAVTPALRFDTGDPDLDRVLLGDGSLPAIIGYHHRQLARTTL